VRGELLFILNVFLNFGFPYYAKALAELAVGLLVHVTAVAVMGNLVGLTTWEHILSVMVCLMRWGYFINGNVDVQVCLSDMKILCTPNYSFGLCLSNMPLLS